MRKIIEPTGAGHAPGYAVAAARLRALAAASGDAFFQKLTTEEHQVAACVLAGDSYAEAARYVGLSPSKARRIVLQILARLREPAP